MAILTLHLKREYWEQIKSGEKTEEYRLATPYWCRRLDGRKYDEIILCCGYPKKSDHAKRIIRAWHGVYSKAITHPLFGPEPVIVFAIPVN